MNKQRNHLVDALRGFAIMGILLLHSIEHFNIYIWPDDATQSQLMLSLNKGIWDTMFFIFGSKTFGIFSLLFGFTFYIQFTKQQKEGTDFGPRFLWRMLWLLVFGWINASLFPGEILLIYAMLSPVLFFVRHLSNRSLIYMALFFLLQPYLMYNFMGTVWVDNYQLPNLSFGHVWNDMYKAMQDGSLLAMVQNSYKGFIGTFVWSLSNGRIAQTIGLFVLGLYLGRKGMFEVNEITLKKWKRVLLVSGIIFGLLLIIIKKSSFEEIVYGCTLKLLLEAWLNLSQLFLMVSLFICLFATNAFQKITKPLLYYGRMSLSNYMMQSLIGGFIFYPYGLGLATKINVTYSLLLGFALFVVFVIFCNLWIKRFRQGPMEKLWHRLTWVRVR